MIDDFGSLRAVALDAGLPPDGFLAAALIQRERFVLGGAAWKARVDFNATSRRQCVVRCLHFTVLEELAAAYRERSGAPLALADAMKRLDPNFLTGAFDAL